MSPQPLPPRQPAGEAARAWPFKDTTNLAVLEAFAIRYKDTFFADLARARIEDLKKQQQQISSPGNARIEEKGIPDTTLLSPDS